MLHPYCRSTTIAVFDDEVMEGLQRRARDPETGKNELIPANMTYREWEKKFVDESGKSGIINKYRGKGIPVNKTDAVSEETIRLVEQTTQMITSAFRALETCSEPIAFENITDALAENCYNPRTGKNQIVLNKGEFSNPEKLLDKLQFDFANGYSYETDTIESLVAHEMGHNAHIALALKRAGLQYGQPLSVIELRLFEEQYKKVSQDIYLYVFENESYDEIQSACIQQLGSMVAHNPNELIAQSFGNYYFGKTKSDIAAKVIKFFRKEL